MSKNIIIREGDSGKAVRRLQHILGEEQTGLFDRDTRLSLRIWQAQQAIGHDGVYGPQSWDAAVRKAEREGTVLKYWPRKLNTRLTLPGVQEYVDAGTSYKRVVLRDEVAAALEKVIQEVRALGGVITTSGSRRGISSRVTKNQSKTSLHMLYRAFDLGVYTGCVNPRVDPLIITQEDDRRYRVWSRAEGAEEVELLPVTIGVPPHARRPMVVRAVDLTSLLELHGFEGVRARKSSWPDPTHNFGGSEYFHFQHVGGLQRGLTAFGDELLQSWDIKALKASPAWKYRHRAWGIGWK